MVVIDPLGEEIREVSIHEQLHIITKPGIHKNQHIKLRARNHWRGVQLPFSIDIHAGGGLSWWAILLIVLGCVAVASVGGFYAWRYWKIKQATGGENDTNKSLLERQADQQQDQGQQEQTQQQIKEELPSPGNDSVEPIVEPTTVLQAKGQASAQIQQSVETVIPAPIDNPQNRSGTINESLAQE